ncbi:MAG TPA: hypothetical protein VFX48_01175 [Saprospiraceae bacterium]|nr:hypothetical protein [Saprospiraceae bacterium]
MKTKLFLMAISCMLASGMAIAQEVPPPPAPPKAPEPNETSKPPEPPAPPASVDTTKIMLGEKQILIINRKDKKAGEAKTDVEKEIDASIEEMKAELEEAQAELEGLQKNENRSPEKHKEMKKTKKKKAAEVDFMDIDLGMNFLNFGNSIADATQDDLSLKTWGSFSTTFTFLPTRIYLGTPHLMLMTSLGWRIGEYQFKEPVDFAPDKTLEYTKNDAIKKSQFLIHQLQIPLSVYVESKKIKGLGRIGIGVGGYAGVLIHQGLEIKMEDPKRKIKTKSDYGFEEFRYGLSGRLDIGAIKLFANMDMNDLWKDRDVQSLECGLWFDF